MNLHTYIQEQLISQAWTFVHMHTFKTRQNMHHAYLACSTKWQ